MLYKLSGALCPFADNKVERIFSPVSLGKMSGGLSLVPLETTQVLYDMLASVSCVSCSWTDQVSIHSDMGISLLHCHC